MSSLAVDWVSWVTNALGLKPQNLPVPVELPEEAPVAKRKQYDQGWLLNVLGGRMTKSGEKVSPGNSVSIGAVYAATRFLSEDIAKLPVGVFQNVMEDGKIRRVPRPNSPAHQVLQTPNDWMNRFKFKQILQTTAIMQGGGFAVIQRDANNTPVELLPLTTIPTPFVDGEGRLMWHVSVSTSWDHRQLEQSSAIVRDEDMLHIPGWGTDTLRGLGIPNVGREPIGTLMATEEHAAKFFANGTAFGGTLAHPNRLDDDARENLRDSINQAHQGVSQSYRLLLLEEGLDFKPVGIDAEKAQLTESRRFGVEEIARIFRMPPHKLMDLTRASFNNAEDASNWYADDTVSPWLENWEASMDLRLLSASERARGYFIQFDLERLRRANLDTRTKATQTMVNTGIITINEARARLDMNPVEGGDVFLRPVNMATVPEGETGPIGVVEPSAVPVEDTDTD